MGKVEYNFKKYEKINSRFEDRITITLSRSFGFPARFCQDNELDNFKYVIIYYDEKNKAIGFSFSSDEQEKNKYSLIRSKKGYGVIVVATSFFKNYKLDPKKYRGKYESKRKKIEGIGQLYIIDLKEKGDLENKSK